MKLSVTVLAKACFRFSLLALLAAGLFTSAQAQNLVTNGDFSNYTDGWSGGGAFGGTYANAGNNGTIGALFGSSGAVAFISQTLTTTDFSTSTYTLSFDFGSSPSWPDNEFVVTWDGQTLFDQSGTSTNGYTTMTFDNLTASTAATVLSFGGRDNPAYLALDNVSVTASAISEVSNIPEPSTYASIFGVLALGAASFRRRTVRA